MSYINRKMRLFKRVNGSQLEPRRSEARLKTYQSAIDVRAWCGVVDDRRRHILELVTKSKEKCLGKLIPVDVIIKTLCERKGESGQIVLPDAENRPGIPTSTAIDETVNIEQPTASEILPNESDNLSPDQIRNEFVDSSPDKLAKGHITILEPEQIREAGIDPSSLKPGTFTYQSEGPAHQKITVDLNSAKSSDTNLDKSKVKENVVNFTPDDIRGVGMDPASLKSGTFTHHSTGPQKETIKVNLNTAFSDSPHTNLENEITDSQFDEKNSDMGIPGKESPRLDINTQSQNEIEASEEFNSDVSLNAEIQELRSKLSKMQNIIEERDHLRIVVQDLDEQLEKCKNESRLAEFGDKTHLIDNVLAERDDLQRRLDDLKDIQNEIVELRQKAKRVDELEMELTKYNNNGMQNDMELRKYKTKCCTLEKELDNLRCERDAMERRIQYMKKEHDHCKCLKKENKLLKIECSQMQIHLNELQQIQEDCEKLIPQMEQLDQITKERDMYKKKYESLLHCPCEIEALHNKLDKYKNLNREKTTLVERLENCICDQEEEIKSLVKEIDTVSRNQELTQPCHIKETIDKLNMELKQKDLLYSEMEKKYKTRCEQLECELVDKNNQIIVLTHGISSDKCLCTHCQGNADTILLMKRELEAARAENRKLQEIASDMAALTTDEHAQTLLKQSQCAVQKIASELGRQYKEWDKLQSDNTKTTKRKSAEKPQSELGMICECENIGKLMKEMEKLTKENGKLKNQLNEEIEKRVELEKKF